MLNSILPGTAAAGISLPHLLICIVSSLLMGVVIVLIHSYKNTYSKNFIITLVLLPAVVQTVIMIVNGNLGTGVAVMGAFGLVRFRSIPGNAREIGSIFLAMAIGLAIGMGYIGTAAILLLVTGVFEILLVSLPFGREDFLKKELKITIPENLDYAGIFDDIFLKYARRSRLIKVKTVNMGSLYELCYHVELKTETIEKSMLDDIRCRNGNLTIVCGRIPETREEL